MTAARGQRCVPEGLQQVSFLSSTGFVKLLLPLRQDFRQIALGTLQSGDLGRNTFEFPLRKRVNPAARHAAMVTRLQNFRQLRQREPDSDRLLHHEDSFRSSRGILTVSRSCPGRTRQNPDPLIVPNCVWAHSCGSCQFPGMKNCRVSDFHHMNYQPWN